MSTEDFEYRIGKLSLEPDDILVVKLTSSIPYDAMGRLGERLREMLPSRKVLVLDPNVDLSVLTAAEIAAKAA